MTTKANNKKTPKRRETLGDQVHDRLIEMGWILPQTEEDVRLARKALERIECPPLPPSLADPRRIIDRLDEVEAEERIKMRVDASPPAISLPDLLKRLREVGMALRFLRRLLPSELRVELTSLTKGKGNEQAVVMQVAKIVSSVFGWALDVILNPSAPLEFSQSAMSAARFKLPARANTQRLSAYTVYAHTVAVILLKATADLPRKPIPTSAEELRDAIKRQYGAVTFEHALRYAWSLGIPVLPLSDSGAFHGACWRLNGRNVVVLKQRVRSLARWLFDLIHELVHAGQNPEQPDLSIIEDEGLDARRLSPEEKNANRIAGNVILDGRAEELAQNCVTAAKGRIELLKRVVPQVAAKEGVAADALANYMAFRLSLQGENWWPTAVALQETEVDPWQVAREVLLERADFSRLHEFERGLLEQALMDEAELEV